MTQIITIGRTSIRGLAAASRDAALRVGWAVSRTAVRAARHFAWDLTRRRSKHDPQARVILPVFAIALVCLFLAGLALGVS